MPILTWLTREHDLKLSQNAPYRLLKEVPDLSVGDPTGGNLIIHGDNLDALKALLPYYAGQVKCIFIDPPYNTRSAFEHYDDNMEHSQWLAMIYPRLELLREFLTEDGSIWVSIDDNEGHYLKVIMDEVFGRRNFIATIAWQNRYSRSNDAIISLSHNSLLVYAKDPDKWKMVRNRLTRSEAQADQYKNPDNDPKGAWRAIPWDAPNIRANLSYPITTPTGVVRLPPPGRHWSRMEDQWLEIEAAGLAYYGKSGDGAPSFKQYLSEASDIVPNTWWPHEEAGHTDEAKKEMHALFGKENVFDTPKPERLIKRILDIATNPGDLVVDSFLGSATTVAVAHKTGRRYIGIEMGDHAITHCAPRLQKVIEGEQGGISKAVSWQGGGGFRFYELGEAIFVESGCISKAITFDALAAHIWFCESKTPWLKPAVKSTLLGVHDGTAYYVLFNGILGDKRPDEGNVLTKTVLKDLPPHEGPKVIYGEEAKFSDDTLRRKGITFRQIPYDIKAR